MSRLIDADKLIEDVLNSMPTGSARGVFRAFIEGQPIAYDVDKVVSELEEATKLYEYEPQMNYYKGISVGCERALEIVKRGWNR